MTPLMTRPSWRRTYQRARQSPSLRRCVHWWRGSAHQGTACCVARCVCACCVTPQARSAPIPTACNGQVGRSVHARTSSRSWCSVAYALGSCCTAVRASTRAACEQLQPSSVPVTYSRLLEGMGWDGTCMLSRRDCPLLQGAQGQAAGGQGARVAGKSGELTSSVRAGLPHVRPACPCMQRNMRGTLPGDTISCAQAHNISH